MDHPLSIREAAELLKNTQQNLYKAIWRGTLRSARFDGQRYTTLSWLKEFQAHKRTRQKSMWNGKPIFDKSQSLYSVKEAAEILEVTIHNIHSYIKRGLMKSSRRGSLHVIHLDEIKKIRNLLGSDLFRKAA